MVMKVVYVLVRTCLASLEHGESHLEIPVDLILLMVTKCTTSLFQKSQWISRS